MLFKVVTWPFRGVTRCSWLFPMYTGSIRVNKFLFIFLLLICLWLQGGCCQEPRRVEGKSFSSLKRITPLVGQGSCIYTHTACHGLRAAPQNVFIGTFDPNHRREQPSGKAFRQSAQCRSVEVLPSEVIRTEGYGLSTDSSYYNYFIVIRVRFHVLQLLNCSFQLSSLKIHLAVIKNYLF